MTEQDDAREFGLFGPRLSAYEQFYGLLSARFLRLYRAGELPPDPDFDHWARVCELEGIEPEPPR